MMKVMELSKKYVVYILVVLAVAGISGSFYFYLQARELQTDPQAKATAETERLVEEIGKLIVLPEGETPTVATVSDPERLKDQSFFAKAKAGDKVLLYSNARKAYLYDPIEKKLLEVAPLNVGGTDSPQSVEGAIE